MPGRSSVDAFAVDKPIYHWACTGADSPWRGKIECLPVDLAQGEIVAGRMTYRDEPGNLKGEAELARQRKA